MPGTSCPSVNDLSVQSRFRNKSESFFNQHCANLHLYYYGSVDLLSHNAKLLALLKVKCEIH